MLRGLFEVAELHFLDLRDAGVRRGAALRVLRVLGLGQVHAHQRQPLLPPRVGVAERLQRGQKARILLQGAGVPGDRLAFVVEPFLEQLPDAVHERDLCAGGLHATDEPLQSADQWLPALGKLVQSRELLEHHGVLGRLPGGALQRFYSAVEVAQTVCLDATDAIQRHRAHRGVTRLLRFAFQNLRQVAPALLAVVQALERVQRGRRARVELQCGLVQLRGALRIAAVQLQQARAFHDDRRTVPHVGGDGGGLALVGAIQRVPRTSGDLGALDSLEQRRVILFQLQRESESLARLALLRHLVFQKPSLLVQQQRLLLRLRGELHLGIEQRKSRLVALLRDQHAARALDRRHVVGQQRMRALVVLGGPSEIADRALEQSSDLVGQPSLPELVALLRQLGTACLDERAGFLHARVHGLGSGGRRAGGSLCGSGLCRRSWLVAHAHPGLEPRRARLGRCIGGAPDGRVRVARIGTVQRGGGVVDHLHGCRRCMGRVTGRPAARRRWQWRRRRVRRIAARRRRRRLDAARLACGRWRHWRARAGLGRRRRRRTALGCVGRSTTAWWRRRCNRLALLPPPRRPRSIFRLFVRHVARPTDVNTPDCTTGPGIVAAPPAGTVPWPSVLRIPSIRRSSSL